MIFCLLMHFQTSHNRPNYTLSPPSHFSFSNYQSRKPISGCVFSWLLCSNDPEKVGSETVVNFYAIMRCHLMLNFVISKSITSFSRSHIPHYISFMELVSRFTEGLFHSHIPIIWQCICFSDCTGHLIICL